MIVKLRSYKAETRFSEFKIQHQDSTVSVCLSVRPPVGLPVMDLILASFGTASLTIFGLCNIKQHNNNRHFTRSVSLHTK